MSNEINEMREAARQFVIERKKSGAMNHHIQEMLITVAYECCDGEPMSMTHSECAGLLHQLQRARLGLKT